MTKPLCIALSVLLAGCTSAPSGNEQLNAPSEKLWTGPPSGTIAVADSMKVTEDSLNKTYFSVQLIVGEGNSGKPTDAFKYKVHATYGHAVADGEIIMPFGGERLHPLLRKGEGYSYIMGFIPAAMNGDTAFHPYYRITGGKEYIRITPLKGYRIAQ